MSLKLEGRIPSREPGLRKLQPQTISLRLALPEVGGTWGTRDRTHARSGSASSTSNRSRCVLTADLTKAGRSRPETNFCQAGVPVRSRSAVHRVHNVPEGHDPVPARDRDHHHRPGERGGGDAALTRPRLHDLDARDVPLGDDLGNVDGVATAERCPEARVARSRSRRRRPNTSARVHRVVVNHIGERDREETRSGKPLPSSGDSRPKRVDPTGRGRPARASRRQDVVTLSRTSR